MHKRYFSIEIPQINPDPYFNIALMWFSVLYSITQTLKTCGMSISLLWNQNKKGLDVWRFSPSLLQSENTTKPPEARNQLGSLKTDLHRGKELAANKDTDGDGVNVEAVESAGAVRYVGGGG